jgi:hypothetical protein
MVVCATVCEMPESADEDAGPAASVGVDVGVDGGEDGACGGPEGAVAEGTAAEGVTGARGTVPEPTGFESSSAAAC